MSPRRGTHLALLSRCSLLCSHCLVCVYIGMCKALEIRCQQVTLETSSFLFTHAICSRCNPAPTAFQEKSAQRSVATLKSLVLPHYLPRVFLVFSPPKIEGGFALPTFEGCSAVSMVSCVQNCLLIGMKWSAKEVVPYCIYGVKTVSVKNVYLPFYFLSVASISLHISFPLLDQ